MPTRRAYGLLAFLTLLNILGFADRSLLAGFSLPVIRDLGMSYAQFSFLSGVAFVGFNSVSLLLTGYLADRVHRPRLIAAGMFIWSAMTALSGLTRSFGQMAVARALVGIGEAGLAPSSLGLLSDVFPARRRGLVLGAFFAGPPVGVACSYFVAALLGPQLGWRTCFLLLGGLGVLLSSALLFIRDPRPASANAGPVEGSLRLLMSTLRSSAALRYLLLGAICIQFSIGATVLDIVWLVKERGFSEAGAQQTAGGLFLVGGLLGTFLGGIGSDGFGVRYRGGRALFLTVVYGVLGPASIVFRLLPTGHVLFYPFMFIGCVNIMLASGAPIAAATELVPERIRSTIIAFTILITSVIGYSAGSFMVGWLSDGFTRLGYADPISWADFWITVASLPGIGCFYAAYRSRQAGHTVPQPDASPLTNQLTE